MIITERSAALAEAVLRGISFIDEEKYADCI